jgi:hypothetical protein
MVLQRRVHLAPEPVTPAVRLDNPGLWREGASVATSDAASWDALKERLAGVAGKLGVTGWPQGTRAPTIRIDTTPENDTLGQIAVQTLLIDEPQKGAWDSYYLQAKSRKQYGDPPGHDIGPSPQGGKIYLEITDEIAAKAKQAEEEHCSDQERAYQISLQPLRQTLFSDVDGEIFHDAKEDVAKRKARRGIHQKLTAAGLGWMGWKSGGWLGRWDLLNEMTRERDTKDWHTFTSVQEPAGADVIVHIVPGKTEIGTHSSAEVVDPAKLPEPG